jgi:predicted TIM-barrel fold metal-dependent hydrolase
MELYEICDRHGLPVLFHSGSPLPLLPLEFSLPHHLMPVVKAFPRLKVWIGHAGAHDWFDDALEVVEASQAASIEMSVWFWHDATEADAVAMAKRLIEARDRVGIERILFGSDHVSGSKERGDVFLPKVASMFLALQQTARDAGIEPLTDVELAQIMGLNAARDLGIEADGRLRAKTAAA